jgi:hypothetical protein
MKKYLFLLFLLTLFSCNRQTDFEKKLVKSKWVMFKGKALKEEVDRWPNSYFIFKEDGTTKSCDMLSDQEDMLINKDGSERLEPLHWSYNDATKELNIEDTKLKMLSTEGDTIRFLRDTTTIMIYNIDKTEAKLKKGPGRCLGG